MGVIFFEKKHFSKCVSHFWRNLFRFSAKPFQHGNQSCIGFEVCQSELCHFLSEFTQTSFVWSLRTALYVSLGLFSWESFFLEKNTFPFVFHILGANFSGFWQNFSTTAVKNALVCTFFSSMFCQFFAELKQIFIDRSVRFALDVTTGMFSWESSSLKKKYF